MRVPQKAKQYEFEITYKDGQKIKQRVVSGTFDEQGAWMDISIIAGRSQVGVKCITLLRSRKIEVLVK